MNAAHLVLRQDVDEAATRGAGAGRGLDGAAVLGEAEGRLLVAGQRHEAVGPVLQLGRLSDRIRLASM